METYSDDNLMALLLLLLINTNKLYNYVIDCLFYLKKMNISTPCKQAKLSHRLFSSLVPDGEKMN